MTNEELDSAVLAAIHKENPNWLPEDDVFCPTEYWADCGPLIDMFEIDVGPHNLQWMAYCRSNVARSAVEQTAKRAICMAVVRMTSNAKVSGADRRPLD